MKNRTNYLLVILMFWLLSHSAVAQISTYAFTQDFVPYVPITGGTLVSSPTGGDDDDEYTPPSPIGFPFFYAGSTYTTVAINPNGWINFVAGVQSTNRINAFSADLVQRGLNSIIRIQTIGFSPNQICVIQYANWGRANNPDEVYNFQIRLFQATDRVSISYGPMTITFPDLKRVSLVGPNITDVRGRLVNSNWGFSSNTASNAMNAATSPTLFPPLGLTFSWQPSLAFPYCPILPQPLNRCIDAITINTINNQPCALFFNENLYRIIPIDEATTTLSAGLSYVISVNESLFVPERTRVSVWIDFNRNGIFEASEAPNFTQLGVISTANVLVPSNASLGKTGMRVRHLVSFQETMGADDACTNYNSTCVTVDYTITLGPGVCSAAPLATSVVSSAYSMCCSTL